MKENNMNIMMPLSKKVKEIIRDDEELTIVHEHNWEEPDIVAFDITTGDSGLEKDDVQEGKTIAEAEIENNSGRIDIHDSVRDKEPDLFKFRDVDVYNLKKQGF